jgi:hypothetical protein
VPADNWQAILTGHVTTILPLTVRLAALQSQDTVAQDEDDGHESIHSNSTASPVIEEESTTHGPKGEQVAFVDRVPTWIQEQEDQGQSQGTDKATLASNRATGRLLAEDPGFISNVAELDSTLEKIYFQPDPTGTNEMPLPEGIDAQGTAKSSLPHETAPNVPPVFTWATGEVSPDGSGHVDSAGLPGHVEHNTVQAEDSLAHICEHLHSKLTSDPGSAEVYITISPQDISTVDQAVAGLLGATITDLIEAKVDSDKRAIASGIAQCQRCYCDISSEPRRLHSSVEDIGLLLRIASTFDYPPGISARPYM